MSVLSRPPARESVSRAPLAARLRVRHMRVDDLDAVMTIESGIYAFPWTRGNFADSLRSGHDAWVFEAGEGAADERTRGALQGYAVAMWIPDEVHLLNLSVAAAMHGHGIGRAMLGWLMRDARRRDARGMMLEVRPSNPVAIALYRSAGFTRIGVRKRYYPAPDGAREDAWVMFGKLGDD